MKRLICMLVIICLCLSVMGCLPDAPYVTAPSTTIPSTTTPPQTQSTTAPTIPETTYPDLEYPYPIAAVSLPVMDATRTANDGTPIFTYSFQTMSLVIPDPSSANSITVDFLNRTDFSNSAANNVDQAALAAYQNQADWTEYFYRHLYTPTRLDQSILSLYGTTNYYDGAPHSTAVADSLTYDLMHGTVLTLRQLLVPNYDSSTLSQLITSHFDPTQTESFYPDYADVILDMFSTNIPVEDWYLTDEGLCFFFNPGEIAPYSEEIPVSTIPYEALNGLLQDAFFPAESVLFYGEPMLSALSADQMPALDHIMELIADHESPRYCLSTNGTVQNIRLYLGNWDDAGNFTLTATVFAAQALTNNTALLLQCPDNWIDSLYITYESGDQTFSIGASSLLQ